MNKACDLTVVMPVYNEEANIEKVIREWMGAFREAAVAVEFLVINDGSKDRTPQVLEELTRDFHALKIVNQANAGHGRSIRHGYNLAVGAEPGWVLQIDSDGQCDPAYFGRLWEQREDADCVFGFRQSRDDGFARKLVSTTCRCLVTLATGHDVKDANVPYRLIRREVLAQALEKIPEDFDIHNVALTLTLKRLPGLRWRYVPIHFRDRQGGSNSINLPKIVRMGWGMLRDLKRIRA